MLRKPVEAVLFDMDGLLIDTEAVYIDALQDAARDLGIEMSLDFCHSMIGISGRECDVMIQNFYGAAFRIDRFRERFSGQMDEMVQNLNRRAWEAAERDKNPRDAIFEAKSEVPLAKRSAYPGALYGSGFSADAVVWVGPDAVPQLVLLR